jgi:predicted membrane protein
METSKETNKGFYSESDVQIDNNFQSKLPEGNNGNKILGIVIVVIGVVLLLRNTNLINFAPLRHMLSFPFLMIIGGLLWGYKEKYKMGGWVFIAAAGLYFFLNRFDLGFERFTLPFIFIVVGLFFILRNRKSLPRTLSNIKEQELPQSEYVGQHQYKVEGAYMGEEYVKIDSIFSGNERNVFSANFKGGKVGTIFGGVKLDCKAAQIQQDIVIDMYCLFGGIELILPANWIVVNEMTSVFGAVEDKRRLVTPTGNAKRVILTGFNLFGGVEIKNI